MQAKLWVQGRVVSKYALDSEGTQDVMVFKNIAQFENVR
jgi:hypothetical protein